MRSTATGGGGPGAPGAAAALDIGAIGEAVTACTRCDLCRTRTRAVPGRGNGRADVMFVGEAPGRSEDLAGEPFVGAAGGRLSAALEGAGIPRDSVYITNVVKCRPPNNRVPSARERDACREYLAQEIAAVRPRMICILGNTAFGSILGGAEITRFRGKVVRKGADLYFLTIHPAATIYNSELVGVLAGDIRRLFALVRELKGGGEIRVDIEHGAGDTPTGQGVLPT